MDSTTITIDSIDDFSGWVVSLAKNLSFSADGATVVALSGPLGVGKTTFTQALLKHFGVTDPVTSPTYTIETVYRLPDGPFARAYHLDAYRLSGTEDLGVLDFSQRLDDPDNLIIIEWAEIVSDLLPEDTLHIDMAFSEDENGRVIKTFYE